jgi:hypothetical protein
MKWVMFDTTPTKSKNPSKTDIKIIYSGIQKQSKSKKAPKWLDIWYKGRMVEINGKGEIRAKKV